MPSEGLLRRRNRSSVSGILTVPLSPRESSAVSPVAAPSAAASPAVVVEEAPLTQTTTIFDYRRLFFFGGIFVGLALTTLLGARYGPPIQFPPPSNLTNIPEYLYTVLGDVDLSSLLPNSSNLMTPSEVLGNLTDSIANFSLFSNSDNTDPNSEFLPGLILAEQGMQAKHPVVLIPGIVSTGLEAWNPPLASKNGNDISGGEQKQKQSCGQKYFRKRLWGTLNQFQAILMDKNCWINHMKLDEETGLDPPGFRLRAAQGLDAADYLFPGYWVFARLISNFAAIGYDNNQMMLASYDWRLGFANMEKRDQYFSRLKSSIEIMVNSNPDRAKAVLISHSMGSSLTFYFLHWVSSPEGGNGGADWNEKYIHGWVNIAGAMLGAPKAVSALLSGEMRDTVQLNLYGASFVERVFPRHEFAALFRSWGGVASILPKGGEYIWGRAGMPAPDEPEADRWSPSEQVTSFSSMITVTTPQYTEDMTATASVDRVLSRISDAVTTRWAKTYGNFSSVATSKQQLRDAVNDPTTWSNPLMAPLPRTKADFRLYCMYGVGLKTERKYFYKFEQRSLKDDALAQCLAHTPKDCNSSYVLDYTVNDRELSIENGFQLSDGDSTVPLISLGYMCADGWKRKRYNPRNIKVITREHLDRSEFGVTNLRGGPSTSTHVEILGNHALIEDILSIVSGTDGDGLQDEYISDIQAISSRVQLPEGLDN
ncbi:Lecithin:cholesterol acyltransferase-domain-containing protein [Polychytrium aggregatum]|uniref:Lecithin:cholesterol acyltransferase-domain-containing protein n=1 Tax=Polychytrium aggregatum TaxID=110093 RepID=UPI0022FE69A5|nr:Lecithin:cholesterol acyltransferase-domain-containing protein [Polychytrium aggregatum]KAI9202260.1 Lecithin:cholesterol acyltransferase-domain-containing protein [Polychytrium aggregatum]